MIMSLNGLRIKSMNVTDAYDLGDEAFNDYLAKHGKPEDIKELVCHLKTQKDERAYELKFALLKILTESLDSYHQQQKELAMHMGVPFEVELTLIKSANEKLRKI